MGQPSRRDRSAGSFYHLGRGFQSSITPHLQDRYSDSVWTDQSRSRSHDSIVVVGLVVAYHNDSFDTDIEAVRRDVVLVRLVANSVFALNLLGYAGIERLKTSNPAGQEQENHRGHALHRYSLSPMASAEQMLTDDNSLALFVGLL